MQTAPRAPAPGLRTPPHRKRQGWQTAPEETGHQFRIKRVYAPADRSDGLRVLVDRLWPRGVAKEKAHIDLWLKDIAPSDALRRRVHSNPTKWNEFESWRPIRTGCRPS